MDTAEIDLRHYIEIIWKWRLVIVLLTGAAVTASAVFSFFVLSPVYETRVTLLVTNAAQSQQSVRPSDGSVAETISKIPAMTLNTYMSQLTSPYFLGRVLGKMGLSSVEPTSLASMVSAQVLKDTSLIEVRVQNTDKNLAAKIANAMAAEFVQFVSETNQERMSKSLAFLAEQQTLLKADLVVAYEELSRIQAKQDSAAAISRELASKDHLIMILREELAKDSTEIGVLEMTVRQIERDLAATPPTLDPGPAGGQPVPNPEHQALVASRAGKNAQLSDLRVRSAAVLQEIGGLERAAVALEARLVIAQNDEAVAKANVARLESTLNLLTSKMVEAQMAHSVNLGETTITVISPALEPVSPVKPRKMLNMAVAGVLGGFVSVLLVFLLEYMDNTVKTQDDVTKYLNLGTLGAIPLVDDRRRRKR